MSTPFSSNEIETLKETIEKSGWQNKGLVENHFRYSINKDKIILFTIKYPIVLPLHSMEPFEVVSFQVCIAFQIWNLNQSTNNVILYFLKMLKNLSVQISMEHDFPINGKEQELLKLLSLIIPERIKNENETTWINRIRISFMNKREQFKEFDTVKITDIVQALKLAGLEPTFKQPWEFNKGLPKKRTSETLFFSNDEPFDEFFILEKGYFTYFKDIRYKNFYIRTLFESYFPYFLQELFKNSLDFKMGVLIENWIKFARLFLNSIIKIIDVGEINYHDFVQFKPEYALISKDFEFDNNFPFSALCYESRISKQLFPIHNDLLSVPPTNFEVLETLNYFTDAEELFNNYKFEEATKVLNDSLKVFNKYYQQKMVAAILLQLRKIASLLNQQNIAMNYLKSALEVAKSGNVPIEYIIKIHYKSGKTLFDLKNFDDALNHFDIIITFLENEKTSLNNEEILGMAYLYKGLINAEQKRISESKYNLKKALDIGNNVIKVKLKYYLLRARQFKEKGNLSSAKNSIKMGINYIGLEFKDETYRKALVDLVLELTEFYIHYRINSKKAYYLLNILQNEISLYRKSIPGIRKAIRWNLLMSDYFKLLEKDNEKSRHYSRQSEILRSQLKKIGVLD